MSDTPPAFLDELALETARDVFSMMNDHEFRASPESLQKARLQTVIFLSLAKVMHWSAQARAVMPLIGPLLDTWECIPNDQRSDLPELARALGAIDRAMEADHD